MISIATLGRLFTIQNIIREQVSSFESVIEDDQIDVEVIDNDDLSVDVSATSISSIVSVVDPVTGVIESTTVSGNLSECE